MALIFPRLAQNYLKRGYYPTDVGSLDAICGAIDTNAERVRICDPCCGEGAALLHLAEHLQRCGTSVKPLAIEIDEERAWRAKEVLSPIGGQVAHADMHDVIISRSAFDFLFLNPPYGELVTDKAGISGERQSDRHEKVFCRRWFPLLQTGGVLALLVPFYVFDEELSTLIARHFDQVRVYLAPEQQFKQAILLGVKRKPGHAPSEVVKRLIEFGQGKGHEPMPVPWREAPYVVPEMSPAEFGFTLVRLDPKQLQDEIQRGLGHATMWPKFRHVFGSGLVNVARRPLCDLSTWHLALALAAGQISGVVRSGSRVMLVKGGTHKAKSIHHEYETRADGSIAQTTIATDKFVPMIKAIDFTPDSEHYGTVFTVK